MAQVAFLHKLKAEYLSQNASHCALFSFLYFFGWQFDACLSVVSTAQVVQHSSHSCMYLNHTWTNTQGNAITFTCSSTVKHNLYFPCCFIHPHDWEMWETPYVVWQLLVWKNLLQISLFDIGLESCFIIFDNTVVFLMFLSVLLGLDKAISLVSGSLVCSSFQGMGTWYLPFSYLRECFTL